MTAIVTVPRPGGLRARGDGRQYRHYLLTGEPLGVPVPRATASHFFDDAGAAWMVLSELDGSLVIRPLPPIQEEEPALEGLW